MDKKLNIGCGKDIKEGWINLDSASISGVDVVHDIENLPLPFEDESVDEVLCQDVLEHVDFAPILRDIFRIMKTRAVVKIRVPHFTSKNMYTDPTHKSFFAIRTFDYFTKKGIKGRSYYFDFHFDGYVTKEITFERSSRVFFYNRFVQKWVNRSERNQYIYESTFLSRLFPAENIIVELKK